MKCPNCHGNHKKSQGMKCSCGYKFTFNPATDHNMTDNKFLHVINRASANDTYYYTLNQLYSSYCSFLVNRKIKAKDIVLLTIGGLMLGIGIYYLANLWLDNNLIDDSIIPLTIFFIIGSLMIIGTLWKPKPKPFNTFENLTLKWLMSEKPLDRLIEKPALHHPPPKWNEPDIYDYGVERLLIVERDLIVDLFVKNGLHADQRALIISESGYPDYLLQMAQKVLNNRPDLPVFFLHDSTEHGVLMKERLQQSPIFPLQNHPVIDLGLFQHDVRDAKKLTYTKSYSRNHEVPVDFIPYMSLITVLETSFIHQMAFQELMATQTSDAYSSFG